MSKILTTTRRQSTKQLYESDSSSDLSAKNNKERMREIKTLSLKGNSFVEHLLGYRMEEPLKKETSVMFHSQKWDFAPILQKNDIDDLTGSTKLNNDNPFFRAKQNFLNKKQVSASSTQNRKYIDEPQGDFQLDNQKTTFRLLKKGSANQPLNGYSRREL